MRKRIFMFEFYNIAFSRMKIHRDNTLTGLLKPDPNLDNASNRQCMYVVMFKKQYIITII